MRLLVSRGANFSAYYIFKLLNQREIDTSTNDNLSAWYRDAQNVSIGVGDL